MDSHRPESDAEREAVRARICGPNFEQDPELGGVRGYSFGTPGVFFYPPREGSEQTVSEDRQGLLAHAGDARAAQGGGGGGGLVSAVGLAHFHQNQYGVQDEGERLVQYVCYMPRDGDGNTDAQRDKRLKYFEDRRTTSHWPYPISVNGKQPQRYGNDDLLIDYSSLPGPDLNSLMDEIVKLI